MKILNRYSDVEIYSDDTDSMRQTVLNAVQAKVSLRKADLWWADLTGADLSGAKLTGAVLRWADLTGADLREADLTGADLTGATMPDGRSWEEYRSNHLEGLCTSDEVRKRVVEAWGNHQWSDCPMHAGYGWDSINDAPEEIRIKVANWITLYDSELLPKP